MTYWQTIETALTELAQFPINPDKRIYWLYLLSAGLLAWVVYWLTGRQRANSTEHAPSAPVKTSLLSHARGFITFLFPRSVWLAPSARLDYQMLVVNHLAKLMLVTPFALTMTPVFMTGTEALEHFLGPPSPIPLPGWQVTVIFTTALFVADDFTRFFLHYLLHKIPWLWEFHKVHHSATVLTPFTIYRSHPVENFLYASRMALTQGLVIAVCFHFFGTQLTVFDILGANVFSFLFNMAGSNLRHSHVWLRFGRLERWLISPAQHQIHHGQASQYYDKNFGTFFAVWDRMFGSLVLAPRTPFQQWGLKVNDVQQHRNLWDIYWQPFRALYLRVKQYRR